MIAEYTIYVMDIISSCFKFLIPIILISISIKTEDLAVAQITGLVGITVFLFSFMFISLWIQLIIVSLFSLVFLFRGDSIIAFFSRKFNK